MKKEEARKEIHQEIGELVVRMNDWEAKLADAQKKYAEAIQKLKDLENKK